jgi:hypothetical protein
MTNPAMTDQQLIDFSREHLLHELTMFWELAEILPVREASTETSAFVESYCVHLRSLIDFFYREGIKDDVTAQDFLDATTTWKPAEPAILTTAHERANKELSHLTQSRISGRPPEKAWDTTALLKEIGAIAQDFATKASAKKVHPKVGEFLKLPANEVRIWIGDNVPRSNVASQVVSSTFGSVSTLTPIIMQTIDEEDRKAFEEIGRNMFIEYTDQERSELAKIAANLRRISKTAQSRSRKAP